MSHIEKQTTAYKNLDAMWAACAALGFCRPKIGQTHHRWYGRFVNDTVPNMTADEIANFGKCAHAIEVDGAEYDIGVYKKAGTDEYYLAYDNYGSGRGQVIAEKLGRNLEKLKTEYNRQLLLMTARKQRHRVRTEDMPGGNIRMTVEIPT